MSPAILNGLCVLPVMACLALFFGTAARSDAQIIAFDHEEPIPLTNLELEGFHRILKTTATQQTTAQSLLDASIAELKTAERRASAIGERYRALPKDQRTPDARERFLKDLTAASPDVAQTRRLLLDDLRALLTVEQLERWRAFEIFLRREAWRTKGSGPTHQHVTLLALVAPLPPDAIPEESRVAAETALERYEHDLDLIIIETNRLDLALKDARTKANAARSVNPDLPDARDHEAVTDAAAALKDANVRISQLNDAGVEAFARFLSPENAAALRKRAGRAALPEAYGPEEAAEAIRAAPGMPGIDEQTRDQLAAIAREFNPAYDALCDRIAIMERAMRRAKPDERPGQTDWDPVRQERQELLVKTYERIQRLVTEDQFQAILRAGHRAAAKQLAALSR